MAGLGDFADEVDPIDSICKVNTVITVNMVIIALSDKLRYNSGLNTNFYPAGFCGKMPAN